MLPEDYSEPAENSKDVRLANLKPFVAGQSGNPKGRQLGSKNRSTIVKEWLEQSTDGEQNIDRVMRALINKASEGDVPAIREALDSAFGKLTDKQEHSGNMTVSWPVPQSKLDE